MSSPIPSTQPSATNPYVGPRPFATAERERFFGREREARELFARVLAERLVLFYAQSGAGKSSLINTRLIPWLEDEGFFVLPVARVGGEIAPTIVGVENVFAFNVMLSLEQRGYEPQSLAALALTNFLSHLSVDEDGRYYYDPSLSPQEEDAPPLHATAEDEQTFVEPPHVLILDQFEEIITTHPTRWMQRRLFFEQLAQAMADDPLLWVVLVVREDYVAALEPYAPLLPNKLRARFYMERMGVDAALEAIREPAAQAGRPFAPGVAETLVDNLRQLRVAGQEQRALSSTTPNQEFTLPGQYLEPVQLQVVCYRLWENLPSPSAEAAATAQITAEDLTKAGDVDTALADFYEAALQSALLVAQGLLATDLSERKLRRWFDRTLITKAGTRGTVYRGEAETAGVPRPVVDALEAQFLLRTESRAGGYWIELIHDRFVEPIQAANRAWLEAQSPLLQAARVWAAEGQNQKRLYSGAPLSDAEQQIAADPDSFSDEERTFIQASTAAELRRRQRRQRLTTAGIVLLILTLSGLAGLAQWNATTANRNANAAAIAQAEALIAKATAEAAEDEASTQAAAALANAAEARAAQAEAEKYRGIARSRQLALLSKLELDKSQYELAMLLAAEAYSVSKTFEASQTLYAALNHGKQTQRLLYGHTDNVNQATWSQDESKVLTSSDDNTARIWDAATGQQLVLLEGHTDVVNQATWSQDESKVLTSS